MYRRWVNWIQFFNSARSTKLSLFASILSTITLQRQKNNYTPSIHPSPLANLPPTVPSPSQQLKFESDMQFADALLKINKSWLTRVDAGSPPETTDRRSWPRPCPGRLRDHIADCAPRLRNVLNRRGRGRERDYLRVSAQPSTQPGPRRPLWLITDTWTWSIWSGTRPGPTGTRLASLFFNENYSPRTKSLKRTSLDRVYF